MTTHDPSTPADPLRSSLLRRLRDRDAEAWRAALHLFGPLIYSCCRTKWGMSAHDADLSRDVVTRVLESIHAFRGGNFVAWQAAITRSRVA
jgi:DNA-directed RNA polymerase specialized sigma24 family protein